MICLLFRKSQMPLFDAPVPVQGHMRDGHFVAPYTARRRRRPGERTEDAGRGRDPDLSGEELVQAAIQYLEQRFKKEGPIMTSPGDVKDYLRLHIASREHEVFAALFLDNRHRLIAYEEMFRGTIDGASVYPREVVKTVLRHNAQAVILAHNHPSGNPEESQADIAITQRLKNALAMIDVRVLDHMIVTPAGVASFAEKGLL